MTRFLCHDCHGIARSIPGSTLRPWPRTPRTVALCFACDRAEPVTRVARDLAQATYMTRWMRLARGTRVRTA